MVDFGESQVCVPEVRPGHCCWVSVWPSAARKGEYYLSFHEKRKDHNIWYRQMPLEFYESSTQEYKYCKEARDVVNEQVVMHSNDNGGTWKEIGRWRHLDRGRK